MTESPTGWYQDDDDPSLARWWDGERWTEHTISLGDDMIDSDPLGWGLEEEPIDDPEDFQNLSKEDLFPDLEETLLVPQPPSKTRFPRPIEGLPVPAATSAPRATHPDDEGDQGVRAEDPTAAFAGLAGLAALRDDEELPFGGSDSPWVEGPPAHRRTAAAGGGLADRMADWPLSSRVGAAILVILVVVGLAVGGFALLHNTSNGSNNASSTSTSSSTTQVTFAPLGSGTTPPTFDSTTTTTSESSSTTTSSPGRTTPTTAPRTTTTTRRTTTTTAVTTTTAAPTTTTTPTTTSTTEPTTDGGTGGPTTGG